MIFEYKFFFSFQNLNQMTVQMTEPTIEATILPDGLVSDPQMQTASLVSDPQLQNTLNQQVFDQTGFTQSLLSNQQTLNQLGLSHGQFTIQVIHAKAYNELSLIFAYIAIFIKKAAFAYINMIALALCYNL